MLKNKLIIFYVTICIYCFRVFFSRPLCFIVFILLTKCILCYCSFPEINTNALPITSGKMYLTFSFIISFNVSLLVGKMLESITRNSNRKLERRGGIVRWSNRVSSYVQLLFSFDHNVLTISKCPHHY